VYSLFEYTINYSKFKKLGFPGAAGSGPEIYILPGPSTINVDPYPCKKN